MVARLGIEPRSLGYEPSMVPLHHLAPLTLLFEILVETFYELIHLHNRVENKLIRPTRKDVPIFTGFNEEIFACTTVSGHGDLV